MNPFPDCFGCCIRIVCLIVRDNGFFALLLARGTDKHQICFIPINGHGVRL